MKEFILLMHSDTERAATPGEWDAYFARLRASGRFQGGSSIGHGECVNKSGCAGPVHERLAGYIKIQASDLEEAKTFLEGNPVFEGGGTVEVRELPRS